MSSIVFFTKLNYYIINESINNNIIIKKSDNWV